jgi:hypothetical protein
MKSRRFAQAYLMVLRRICLPTRCELKIHFTGVEVQRKYGCNHMPTFLLLISYTVEDVYFLGLAYRGGGGLKKWQSDVCVSNGPDVYGLMGIRIADSMPQQRRIGSSSSNSNSSSKDIIEIFRI